MAMPLPTGILAAEILILGLGVFSAFCSLRWLAAKSCAAGRGRRGPIAAACGMAILVFGVRLAIADGRVSWMPYLDQWEAEIGGLVAPLAHGTLTLHDLFAANNEHRIVLTRAFSLAVVELNGGWDNRAMVIGMFVLQSATTAWICALAWSALGFLRGSVVGLAAALPMFLICDWENIVSGFQDQFGFMVLGSVVAFSLAENASIRSLAGAGALIAALLLLGSMASGMLTAAVMAAICLLPVSGEPRNWKTAAGFFCACSAIAAFGWLARSPFPHVASMYAQSPGAWMSAFLAYAAWPLPPNSFGLACLWLPCCVLLVRSLGRRKPLPLSPFILGLGLWVLLQAGVLAWSRAGLSGLVSSRYTEVLALGFVANTAAFAVLSAPAAATGKARAALWAGFAVWLAAIASCEVRRSQTVYRPYFDAFRQHALEHEQRVGAFMRTGDASVIEGVEFPHIPYLANQILPLLRDPVVQPLLPGPLRRDLVRDRDSALLPSVRDGPLSFVAIRLLRSGRLFILLGLATLGAGWIAAHRAGVTKGIPGTAN